MQGRAAAARLADALRVNLAGGELAPALADGLAVQAEQGGRPPVAAVAAQQRGEAGEQAALLLVQQAAEQGDRRRQAAVGPGGIGRCRQRRGTGRPDPAGGELALLAGGIEGAVDRVPVGAEAGELAVADEPGEGVDGAHAEQVVEFGGAEAERGAVDQGTGGGAERAVGGEADVAVGPQAVLVKPGAVAEGVELAAMGIGGEVAELLELAGDGAGGGVAESGGEFGESGDGLATQESGEVVGGEGRGPHGAVMNELVCCNIVILS